MSLLEGNCYATSEAAYHLLGGKDQGWMPKRIPSKFGQSHWFLEHETGVRVDLTAIQYNSPPDYDKAVGCGFLTREPSRAARHMIDLMVWKDNE